MVDGGKLEVDSRDEGKHAGRNDLLFVEKMMWMDACRVFENADKGCCTRFAVDGRGSDNGPRGLHHLRPRCRLLCRHQLYQTSSVLQDCNAAAETDASPPSERAWYHDTRNVIFAINTQ